MLLLSCREKRVFPVKLPDAAWQKGGSFDFVLTLPAMRVRIGPGFDYFEKKARS